MPSAFTLLVWIVTGMVGMGYFVYGKRRQRIAFLAAGAGLCIYPYLVDGPILQIPIGLGLMAAPFFFDQ